MKTLTFRVFCLLPCFIILANCLLWVYGIDAPWEDIAGPFSDGMYQYAKWIKNVRGDYTKRYCYCWDRKPVYSGVLTWGCDVAWEEGITWIQ